MGIKQVTVFGGSGFIGQAIVRALAAEGYLVKAAARRLELAEPLKTAGRPGQVTLVRADLHAPESVVAAISGSQAVVNAAGARFEKGGQTYDAVDAAGSRTVAEAASVCGAERLILISSIDADNRGSAIGYLRSKTKGEDAAIKAFEGATILRPSAVFGAGDMFFTGLAQLAASSWFVPLVGTGTTRWQPVYVGDIGKAVAAALRSPDTAGRVFELGGPRVYSFRELVDLTQREIASKRPVVPLPVGLMKGIGWLAQQVALLGMTPPMTRTQVEVMTLDNVVSPDALGLADLGIVPTALEAVLPGYIGRFRIGGSSELRTIGSRP